MWNMSFKYRLLLALIGLLLNVHIANACSCRPKPTVLAAYEGASVVVIARAVSVEKAEHGEGSEGIRSTKMVVEKVFKGDLKVGDEMPFGQGGNTDCIWGFYKPVGQRFLLYLGPREENSKMWYVMSCGRSRGVEDTEDQIDDLLYLNRLKEVSGKTRISGTIQFVNGGDVSVEGRTIRILGGDKSYEVKTNKNGVYEIYDLPAGKYLIEPEGPGGWKLSEIWLRYSLFLGDDQGRFPKQIPIVLADKGHTNLDVQYEIDTAIRGKVYDPNGNPMQGVCIGVQEQRENRAAGILDCTKEDGSFVLTRLARGNYFIVVNSGGKISSREPFKTFYYPNVFAREKAVAVAIREGESLEGINIYAPKTEETITIEGTLLYSDGQPVVKESVQFKAEKTKDDIEGDANASTDSNGRFSIKILKGLKGRLYGEMSAYTGKFENCPQLDSIIKKGGERVETSAIEIQAESSLSDVELRYPFPSCKKAW